MKKILIVGDFIKGSGLTNYLLNMYDELSTKNLDVECVSYSGYHDLDDEIAKKHWKKYDITPVNTNIFKHVTDWFHFFWEHRGDYQFVHFNYSSSWNFWGVLIAKILTRSVLIVQSHNVFYSKEPKKLQKVLLNFMNKLGRIIFNKCANRKIAVSKESAVWMFGKKAEVKVLKNGINERKFKYNSNSREYIRKKFKFSPNKIILGFVGVLDERKNPKFAIHCLKRLNELDNKYVLLIFGRGPLNTSLIKLVKDLHLENEVYFMGVSDELYKWYSVFDLFLFPSITEGFGFALLEAQASGLPCFVSTGIPKDAILTEDVVRIDLINIEKWVSSLKKVDLGDRNKKSTLNCQIIKKNGFSLDESAKKFFEILNGEK